MPRKQLAEKETITIYLPKPLYRRFRLEVERRGIKSRSDAAVAAIEAWLANRQSDDVRVAP